MEKLPEQEEYSGSIVTHTLSVERMKNGIRVKIAGVENPMREEYYIVWIEVTKGKDLHVHGLKPGDVSEAEFPIHDVNVKALVYCEQHGVWSNKPAKPGS